MIALDHTVLSDDIAEREFVCDLIKCKGACCAEGDLGAPLEDAEIVELEKALDAVKPFMSKRGLAALEKQGHFAPDPDGGFGTPLVDGNECVFAIKEKAGSWKCSIEQAWKAGKTDFRKPISCHLYPIRVTKKEHYHLLNYHRWYICSPACRQGEALGVPVYVFLKEPLIRAYGADWYERLCSLIDERTRSTSS